MSDGGRIDCSIDGDVAYLSLVHPVKVNALSDVMWVDLAEHVRRLDADRAVRMVVLRGHGDDFSSGADLADLVAAAGDGIRAQAFGLRVAEAIHALASSSSLTVAALAGHVRGGGAELALACDLRVAQWDATLQIPVARLGIVPDRFTIRRLADLVGPAWARRVLLLAQQLDATECFRIGLVDDVVPVGGLDDAVDQLAQAFRPTVDTAVRATKRMLLETEELMDDPGMMISEFVESISDRAVERRGRLALDRAGRRM